MENQSLGCKGERKRCEVKRNANTKRWGDGGTAHISDGQLFCNTSKGVE
jgi:hypothetical protein